ncbi:hypothetical protein NESM_000490400 [Novymonas esmeraldas]|uniref:C3H1-type domain-containing protein n=1 Tax=Novymonas esmeraldas TaxID=1808958 RepID=A0AAW0EPH3_9TRYP
MSWWNDLSTHRGGGHTAATDSVARQQPQPQPVHERASSRDAASPVSTEQWSPRLNAATAQSGGAYAEVPHHGGGAACGPAEAKWAAATDRHRDGGFLWQTANSADGVTTSDQLTISVLSSAWGSPSLRHPRQASPPQQPLSLSATVRVVENLQLSPPPSTKEDRRGSGACSGSSDAHSNAVGVPSYATDYCGPSSVSGTGGAHTNVAAYSRGARVPSSTHTIRDDGDDDDSIVADGTDDGADEDTLYDEADVGTISSLLASLRVGGGVHHTETDTAADAGAEAPLVLSGASAQRGGTPACAEEAVAAAGALHRASVFYDPSAGGRRVGSQSSAHSSDCRSSSGSSRSRQGSNGAPRSHDAATGDKPAAATTTTTTTAGPLLRVGDTPSLQLTPCSLHNVLASFQSALLRPDGPASGLRSHHRASPVASSEEWGGQTLPCAVAAGASSAPNAGDHPSTARNGSPVMRGRVTSVVAHKLNLDSATRRPQPLDLRGGGSIPPTTAASLDSTCSSDIHTPTHIAQGTRLGVPQHLGRPECAVSSDSSFDRSLMQTTCSAPGAALHHHHHNPHHEHQRAASFATDEGLATPHHHHIRTASEVSLPAAAATYNGGSALQQRVDERGCVTVVDPQRRKLRVPLSAILSTKALNGRLKTPSLCLLYQSGRCRQGDNCYQVHVDPTTVERLRAEVESMPCCCYEHGDGNDHLANRAAYEGRSLGIAGQFVVPLSRVAYTAGLRRVLQEEQACAPVSSSVLCRLHGLPGGCRFGADCKFIHVCCQLLRNELASIMANAAAASTASTAVVTTLRDTEHLTTAAAAVPVSPPTFVHSHTSSTMSNVNSVASVPLSVNLSAAMLSRPMFGVPLGVTVSTSDVASSPSLTLMPSAASQQTQQAARPGNGSPLLADLMLHHQLISSQGGAVHGSGSAVMSTYHPTTGVARSPNFTHLQLPPGMAISATGITTTATTSTGAVNAFANRGPAGSHHTQQQQQQHLQQQQQQQQQQHLQQQQQQQQQQHLQHYPQQQQHTSASSSMAAPSTTTFYALTAQPQSLQVSAPRSPPPPPSSSCKAHARTLSTHSNGTYYSYASPPLAQTPNHSGAASPMTMGLTMMTRSFTNPSAGVSTATPTTAGFLASPAQHQLLRHVTPPQPSLLPPTSSQSSQPPLAQLPLSSSSQQFYVQHVNADGSLSLVPINVVQNFSNCA